MNWMCNGLRKNKANGRSFKCKVPREEVQAADRLGLYTSDFTLPTAAQPRCQTKPIGPGSGLRRERLADFDPSRARGRATSSVEPRHYKRVAVPNEANSRLDVRKWARAGGTRSDHAGQRQEAAVRGQGPVGGCTNEPNRAGDRNSSIPLFHPSNPTPIVRNKPNSGLGHGRDAHATGGPMVEAQVMTEPRGRDMGRMPMLRAGPAFAVHQERDFRRRPPAAGLLPGPGGPPAWACAGSCA